MFDRDQSDLSFCNRCEEPSAGLTIRCSACLPWLDFFDPKRFPLLISRNSSCLL